ncbi:hypothetical protein OsccyDRAFT_0960 [Leptolyngbyaceae cyanobacterium JSC-12]|nr:hypothetical protein OsccyDRAFT_0960 [Leptolyngbyaceae cyanobacterium JSC-12]
MTQKRVRRRSHSDSRSEYQSNVPQPARSRRSSDKPLRDRRNLAWTELRVQDTSSSNPNWLASLIEQDAPLKTNSTLVLMYGPFQAEMASDNRQGIASWLRDCVGKHGLPSLVRFDYRQRAQVFRRDQFQPWLEPFLNKSA